MVSHWHKHSVILNQAAAIAGVLKNILESSFFLSRAWDLGQAQSLEQDSRTWRAASAAGEMLHVKLRKLTAWYQICESGSLLVACGRQIMDKWIASPLRFTGMALLVFAATNGLVRLAQNALGPRGLLVRAAAMGLGLVFLRSQASLPAIISSSRSASVARWLVTPDPGEGDYGR
ncbi:MAG: hypothetical protein AB1497_01205 [Bacillota bacterium]